MNEEGGMERFSTARSGIRQHAHTRLLSLLAVLAAIAIPYSIDCAHHQSAPSAMGSTHTSAASPPSSKMARAQSIHLPVYFEPAPAGGAYIARTAGFGVMLSRGSAQLTLRTGKSDAPVAITLGLDGANSAPEALPDTRLPGHSSYFAGTDAKGWRSDVPQYAGVRFASVYPGIDIDYHGNDDRNLESDFIVAAGADPAQIRMRISGTDKQFLDADGNLHLQIAGGDLVEQHPSAWQTFAGQRKRVSAAFKLRDDGDVAIQVAAYDRTQPLMIDPPLAFSTFLGGDDLDLIYGTGLDSAGNIYVTMTTQSDITGINAPSGQTGTMLPAPTGLSAGSVDNQYPSHYATYKLSPDGRTLLYAAYVAGVCEGNAAEGLSGMAVNGAGEVYVTGCGSQSFDDAGNVTGGFPATPGAFLSRMPQRDAADNDNAVAYRLSADGNSLIFATFINGTNTSSHAYVIAPTGDGGAVVGGYVRRASTDAADFPLMNPIQNTIHDAGNCGGGGDLFATRLSANGNALVYSTFFGGNGCETYGANLYDVGNTVGSTGVGLTLDAADNAYFVLGTNSDDFPVTEGPTNGSGNCCSSALIKINANGTLGFSTYVGTPTDFDNQAQAITLDAQHNIYICGIGQPPAVDTDQPLTAGAYNNSADGTVTRYPKNTFLFKYDPTAANILYAGWIGGSHTHTINGNDFDDPYDVCTGIAVDSAANEVY
ncbi:MAG TPA: hypothetical protein VHE81_22145, partial [Lacipirellulaceae bacterium]|nr:hypothetical protein [Lacipirellulaceae bacterium]